MTFRNSLPSVLVPTNGDSSISMERAIKQVLELMEYLPVRDDSFEDRVNASTDDLKTMLAAIER